MVGVGAVTAAGVKGSPRRPSAAPDPGSRGSGNATRCDTPPETVTERHMLRLRSLRPGRRPPPAFPEHPPAGGGEPDEGGDDEMLVEGVEAGGDRAGEEVAGEGEGQHGDHGP